MQFIGLIILGYIVTKTFGEYILGFIFLILLVFFIDFRSLSKSSNSNSLLKSIANTCSQHQYAPNYTKRTDITPMHDDSNGWDDKTKLFVRYPSNLHEGKHFWTSCKSFTVIDFETANAYSDSVCQIGIVKVVDNIITESFSYYIRPPYKTIRDSNYNIHKISWANLAKSSYFDELWPILKPYIQDQYIAAYNADFDIGCLESLFKCYGIKNVSYAVFDILDVAKFNWNGLNDYKLQTMTSILNIPHNPHQAESDAIAAAQIQIKANQKNSHIYLYTKRLDYSKVPNIFKSDWEVYTLASEAYKQMLTDNTDRSALIYSCLDKIIEYSNDTKYLAKVCRLYGEVLELNGFIDEALSYYKVALSYNEKIGVKRKIKVIENQLAIEKIKLVASHIKK